MLFCRKGGNAGVAALEAVHPNMPCFDFDRRIAVLRDERGHIFHTHRVTQRKPTFPFRELCP
jgi:hypothetical protein